MTRVVITPKETVDDQVVNFNEVFAARLRESGLEERVVRHVLETSGNRIIDNLVDTIRRCVEQSHLSKLRLWTIGECDLGPIARKPTRDCFAGPQWERDPNIAILLPVNQPETPSCTIRGCDPSRAWNSPEAAKVILGDIEENNLVELGVRLIKQGHTMSLPQAEQLAEKLVCSYHHMFFVETRCPQNPVIVGHIDKHYLPWRIHLRDFKKDDLSTSCKLHVREP